MIAARGRVILSSMAGMNVQKVTVFSNTVKVVAGDCWRNIEVVSITPYLAPGKCKHGSVTLK